MNDKLCHMLDEGQLVGLGLRILLYLRFFVCFFCMTFMHDLLEHAMCSKVSLTGAITIHVNN